MSQLITTPEIRTEPTKRWLLPLLEAIQNVSGTIGKGSLILMLSMSVVSNSMAESEPNASSRHTPLTLAETLRTSSADYDEHSLKIIKEILV